MATDRLSKLLEPSEVGVPMEGAQYFALDALNTFTNPRWVSMTEFLSYFPKFKGRPHNCVIEAVMFVKISDPVIPRDDDESGAPLIMAIARTTNGQLHTEMSRPLMRSRYRTDLGFEGVMEKIYTRVGDMMATVALELKQPDYFLQAAKCVKGMEL